MSESAKGAKVRLVEVRAPNFWYTRVAEEAHRLGLPVSTFIRVAVNDWLDRKATERAALAQGIALDNPASRITFVKSGASDQRQDDAARTSGAAEKTTKIKLNTARPSRTKK